MTVTVDTDHGWWLDAECRGLTTAQRDKIFFPGRGDLTAPAKRICEVCPVSAECLEWAMTVPEKHGIWGGKSERERRQLRRAVR